MRETGPGAYDLSFGLDEELLSSAKDYFESRPGPGTVFKVEKFDLEYAGVFVTDNRVFIRKKYMRNDVDSWNGIVMWMLYVVQAKLQTFDEWLCN